MNQNNNTNQPNPTLSEATETVEGTSEQGALKQIHRDYNKLSGFEAMIHIIKKYRFVLYPFILLSIAGSTYSYYNDFIKAFPMLGDNTNLIVAFFFSVMLEIVRDGSLIAVFNSKMNHASRLLVVTIFLAVTTYMYSSHLKAIDVIEAMAIEYTLTHQDEHKVESSNPAYKIAKSELRELKSNLANAKAEKSPQLITNSTSIHTKKREDALSRIDKIDAKVKRIQAEISQKNKQIIGFEEGNIRSIEDSQKLISSILLATLLLVESLAMLGAVIKFIQADNANKEIAKHQEIVEEYVEISEQMKQGNERLVKDLSNVVKGQARGNKQVMAMISEDMQETSSQNIEFIRMIAENKRSTMQQMNQVLSAINSGTVPYPHETYNTLKAKSLAGTPQPPLGQGSEYYQEPTQTEQPKAPQMGFIKDSNKRTSDDLEDRIFYVNELTDEKYNYAKVVNNFNEFEIMLHSGKAFLNIPSTDKYKICDSLKVKLLKNGDIVAVDNDRLHMLTYQPWTSVYQGTLKGYIKSQMSTPQVKQLEAQPTTNQIGFKIDSKDDLIKAIFSSVKGTGDKIPSKGTLVNVNNRTQTKIYESTMRELKGLGLVHFERGYGYYMAVDKDVARAELNEAM